MSKVYEYITHRQNKFDNLS